MEHRKAYPLLLEYVESSLDQSVKVEIEEHLRKCRECQSELTSIQRTFDLLEQPSPPDIPHHYFSSLLPRIRERIDRADAAIGYGWIPSWLVVSARPVGALIILLSMVVLYQSLGPESSPSIAKLNDFILRTKGGNLEDIHQYLVEIPDPIKENNHTQPIVETIPGSSSITATMEEEMLSESTYELTFSPGNDVYGYDLQDYSEDEVIRILERMSEPSIL